MTKIADIDLTLAERDFTVANTPLFLLRRLQRDSAVRRISESMTTEEILSYIRDYVTKEPATVREAVLPYACLVALSIKPDIFGLKNATLIVPHAWHRWFNYMRTVLVQLSQHISRAEFKVPVGGTTNLSTANSDATSPKTMLLSVG